MSTTRSLMFLFGAIYLTSIGWSLSADDQRPFSNVTADTVIDDTTPSIVIDDPAYDVYLDIRQLDSIVRNGDASQISDMALQLAHGERVLLRPHSSGASAKSLLRLAAKAADPQDMAALARLREIAEVLGDKDLLQQMESIQKLGGTARAVDPALVVSLESTEFDTVLAMKGWLKSIQEAELLGDNELLEIVEAEIEDAGDVEAAQREAIVGRLNQAYAVVTSTDAETADLSQLLAASRGWDPQKTIGKLADGDIVGAIDGADFRIPQNETGFNGNSGRRWTMIYKIENRTNDPITVVFVKSGNKSRIQPGKTITCRSRASVWGNEKTGKTYDYPQVRATSPDGKTWLRTIKYDGEDYSIIRRKDGGIQIIP